MHLQELTKPMIRMMLRGADRIFMDIKVGDARRRLEVSADDVSPIVEYQTGFYTISTGSDDRTLLITML